MLRLTLTLVPRGDEKRARELGRVEIENDCTGAEALGNYRVTMRGIKHADVELRDVDRARGPWALAWAAMRAIIGDAPCKRCVAFYGPDYDGACMCDAG